MAEISAENPVFPHKGREPGEKMADLMLNKRGCCFCFPCFGSDRSNSGDRSSFRDKIRIAENEDRWWIKGWKALKKIKDWSEIMAGPRWKTFLRRFNRNSPRVGLKRFQYDPLSYSLNFDEGAGQNGHLDEEFGFRDFSSRYASISASTKSSMDLGKDPMVFT